MAAVASRVGDRGARARSAPTCSASASIWRARSTSSVGVAEGIRAGKVLIDLKTGGFSPSHLDDLRFYALIETIKLGVPPRRVATHYLDTGKLVPEDVTEATLAVAARRVVDGVRRWLELRGTERDTGR